MNGKDNFWYNIFSMCAAAMNLIQSETNDV